MNKEQLQFFYDEIMGMFGWDDEDTASGVDPLLWAKAEIGRTLEIVKEQRKRIMEFQVAEKDYVATLRAELDEANKKIKVLEKLHEEDNDLAKLIQDEEAKVYALRAELDELMVMKNRWVETAESGRGTINSLSAQLAEWHNAAKFVADGCKDEIHCGCVPILKRELDAKTKAVDEAREAIKYLVYDLEHVSRRDHPEGLASCKQGEAWLTAHPEGKEE